MITSEQAFEYIRSLNLTRADEIKQLTKDRLSGKDSTPVGSDYFLEPSEDLLIQLLCKDDLPDEIRTGILEGCIDLYAQAWGWLASPDYREKIDDYKDAFIRLCRVIDAASPEELERHAYSILNLVLEKGEDPPSEVLGAAVRECMGYVQTEQHVDTWEKVINFRDASAYAFNMFLSINPYHIRIERSLIELWRRQTEEDWPIDTAFLMRRADRLRDQADLVYWVLLRLETQKYWDKVKEQLGKKSWSKEWLDRFPEWKVAKESPAKSRKVAAYPEPVHMFYTEFIGSSHHYQLLAVKSEPSDFYSHERTKDIIQKIGDEDIIKPKEWSELIKEISNDAESRTTKDRDERIRS